MAHELAGKPAPPSLLIDVAKLIDAYYTQRPDPAEAQHLVSFGTSGHRGSSLSRSFNEAHILAITQAICEYRHREGITGPLFLGKDTHALSAPAERTALEVLAANGVHTIIQQGNAFTPTPSISHAILTANRGRRERLADGIVVTPSHNPPEDGGFKYNPPNGGPADTIITNWVQDRANELMRAGNAGVKRVAIDQAVRGPHTEERDLVAPYVEDLPNVVDIQAIASARVKCAVDPMGGAALAYYQRIAERYALDLTITNDAVDPRFSFMTLDHDGKIRMDCSSPYAMAKLVAVMGTLEGFPNPPAMGSGKQGSPAPDAKQLRSDYRVAFGNDADADRHGIVVPSVGLMNPNHYLAVAIQYLFGNRPSWPAGAAIGKTLVSSALIDRVAKSIERPLREVPVGFKWFVDGLLDGSFGFGGEESAGASFLRRDGTVWTTDKDGIILALLAAEIVARTDRDPGEHHQDLVSRFGEPVYTRIDQPATPQEKSRLKALSPADVKGDTLAGEPIREVLTKAPGNGASIGGLKVVAESGWFAARPSGTENIYKIYAESFRGREHLDRVVAEARELVKAALG